MVKEGYWFGLPPLVLGGVLLALRTPASVAVGAVLDLGGWDQVFYMFIVASALAVLFLFRLLLKECGCRRPASEYI